MSESKNLLFAIVFSAFLISASVFYLGYSLSNNQQTDFTELAGPLSDRVSEKVIKELTDSDWLSKQLQEVAAANRRIQAERQQQAQAEQERAAQEQAKSVRRVSPERDHIRGDPDALISLIEYSDFECPYCKRFHNTPIALLEEYEGKLNWVYRHFPLGFHNPGAQKQAEASECVAELGGNEAFWQFTDVIYEQTRSGGRGFPLDRLAQAAQDVGVDVPQFQECYESERHASRVLEDFREGSAVGIRGTPGSILINNKTGEVIPLSGAQPKQVFAAAIERLLRDS